MGCVSVSSRGEIVDMQVGYDTLGSPMTPQCLKTWVSKPGLLAEIPTQSLNKRRLCVSI